MVKYTKVLINLYVLQAYFAASVRLLQNEEENYDEYELYLMYRPKNDATENEKKSNPFAYELWYLLFC